MKIILGVIRNSSKKLVESKKFNIYIGISLGNKFFTIENLRECIKWALEHTKDRVGLLVADTLHAINYEVKDDMHPLRARKKSLRKGDETISILKLLINELPLEKQKMIDIIRWDDIRNNDYYDVFLQVINQEFDENKDFKKCILETVEEHFKDSSLILNKEKINGFCRYIINEFPALLNGFNYKGTYYNCYIYPYDTLLTKLIEDILNKKKFQHFHDVLKIKGNIFVELKNE